MRRYISFAAALMACAAVNAQNLNPTVQVTNDYEGKPMEVEKKNVGMAVPDSLLKFDWNFNYSVFDNPYKGAYEFSPYKIEMKPGATVRDNGMFYLRAGAGYSLHPEAQAVFTPKIKGRFGLSVYDDFNGYSGLYHNVTAIQPASGPYKIGPYGDYSGYGFSNRAGTTLRYDAPSAVITLDGGFDLLRTKDVLASGNNAMGGSAVLRARSIGQSRFLYDVSLGWNGLGNKVNALSTNSAFDEKYEEYDAGLDARLVYRFADRHSLHFEPSFHHVVFREQAGSATSEALDIVPSYAFSDGPFSVRLGVRFSNVWRNGDYSGEVPLYKGRRFYPEARMYYEAIPERLTLTAKFVGGQRFNTYHSYLESNRHLSMISSWQYGGMTGDVTVNTFDAGIGVSGRVRSRFQYSAEAGYARFYNAPMDAVGSLYFASLTSSSTVYVPVINMVNYDLMYATFKGDYSSDRIDASAVFNLRYSDLHPEAEKGYSAVGLPLFSGSASFVYNWNRRVFAGLVADWATGREGEDVYSSYGNTFDCRVPGWVDLGVTAEYRLNKRFSLWAEGRNLLNQTVMRNFMVSEKGPYFTAGICLNF